MRKQTHIAYYTEIQTFEANMLSSPDWESLPPYYFKLTELNKVITYAVTLWAILVSHNFKWVFLGLKMGFLGGWGVLGHVGISKGYEFPGSQS